MSGANWRETLGAAHGAHLSGCGRYRTLLWRSLDLDSPPLVFAMLNPSTADDQANDPTITRCLGFARREQAGGIVVVNLSPWRATDPQDLEHARKRGEDVVRGEKNRAAWALACSLGPVVPAWGAGMRSWMAGLALELVAVARTAATRGQPPPRCLGWTKGRNPQPRHPLMLRADTPLQAFR